MQLHVAFWNSKTNVWLVLNIRPKRSEREEEVRWGHKLMSAPQPSKMAGMPRNSRVNVDQLMNPLKNLDELNESQSQAQIWNLNPYSRADNLDYAIIHSKFHM